MERLTQRREDGSVMVTKQEYSDFHMEVINCEYVNDRYHVRLAEYEDIGLTPEEIKNTLTALTKENDLQQQSIQSLSRQVVTLHKALDDIYPLIAGRVTQLRDAGEEKAMEVWNQAAVQIIKVLEGVPERGTQDLSCQVVALRGVFKWIKSQYETDFTEKELKSMCPRDEAIYQTVNGILASPDPGAKIKAVVEAAWELVDCETRTYSRSKYVHKLRRALAGLEGGTSRD